MPIKEISIPESREIARWVGSKQQGFHVGQVGEEEIMSVALVDKDPIVIFYNKVLNKRTLSCGENLVNQLEKEGIIKFPKTKKSKK